AQEASPRAVALSGADTMLVAPLTTAAGPSRSVVAAIAGRSFASTPSAHRSDEPRVPAARGSTAARTTSSEVTEVDRQSRPAVDPPRVLANKVAMTRKLVEIVGERTGYPAELLKLNVDIESDLSIDSIKRVEILGALLSALPTAAQEKTRAAMETLTTLKTL